jgi:drug/metabolite transporter (DMT)-like permease
MLRIISQLLIKKGVSSLGSLGFATHKIPSMLIRLVFQKDVFIGFIVYGLATILWLVALSKVELSYAFPFISLGLIFTPVSASRLFGEKLSIYRKLGISVIVIGLLLIALS